MQSDPRPERIAAAARALGGELLERFALAADAIADALAGELNLVAWDRELVIGSAQARQADLRERRFRSYGGAPVCVLERRAQPLESIELVWSMLRQGRRVRLEHDDGACSAAMVLMRGMGSALGYDLLTVADGPTSEARLRGDDSYEFVGVEAAVPRVALVHDQADRELAAYLLARGCLRRNGLDPRRIRVAYVVGPLERLQRHLQRLWVGARLGSARDPDAFAGPIDSVTKDRFLLACKAWENTPGVRTLCAGGVLERTGDPGAYVAPALFMCEGEAPAGLPLDGPILVLVSTGAERARAAFVEAGRQGLGRLQIGGPQLDTSPEVAWARGALIVERLPPGLPDPRPA